MVLIFQVNQFLYYSVHCSLHCAYSYFIHFSCFLDLLQPSENSSFHQSCAAGRDAEAQLKDVQQSLSLPGSAFKIFVCFTVVVG